MKLVLALLWPIHPNESSLNHPPLCDFHNNGFADPFHLMTLSVRRPPACAATDV